jgi:oligopeptide transport system ATP-binding protein
MSLVEVKDLVITLTATSMDAKAVNGLSFHLESGEILGIAGESGSGKTMTALTLLGLLPYKAQATGSLIFDGKEVLRMSNKQYQHIRGKEIAMVFQDPMTSLHPMLTIEMQLTEHLKYHHHIGKDAARAKALEMLATVKIPDPAAAMKAYPIQFSGGMRQRIAIAMALICEPKLLIADEPTTALDVTVQAGILKLISQLRKQRDLSVIVITHDLGILSAISDRILIMYAGAEVESGRTSDVLQNPRHPYTRGLIDALPKTSGIGKSLESIDGMPPELGSVPSGCAFHPRCSFAQETCSTQKPSVVNISSNRRIFCPIDPLVKS